jgi:hypothetical protein
LSAAPSSSQSVGPARDSAALEAPAQPPRLVITIALPAEDQHRLLHIDRPERFRYRPLGDGHTGGDPEVLSPRSFVLDALAELRALPERPAGIIATDDYPATQLAAAIASAAKLPGPSFESVLACAHKGWSRILQREAAPEAVPRFQLIDPHRRYRSGDLELPFPFWLKPVKSALSYLGYRVSSLDDMEHVQARACAELPRYARAFTEMLEMSKTPPPAQLAESTGEWLIAEELIGGRQCTLEGYFARGRMELLGIVDSVRTANRMSFARFEHPSRLPALAQRRMAHVAERVMRRAGFNDGIFNIEFFVDPEGRPWIIEINPRLCLQFADLYAKVDGRFTHQVLVELASGLVPEPPRARGPYRVAASFVLRVQHDCIVRRIPNAEDMARVNALYPDTQVHALAKPGERLSDHAQDSYSFRYGLVHLGAESRSAMRLRFARIMEMLRFELEPVAQAT